MKVAWRSQLVKHGMFWALKFNVSSICRSVRFTGMHEDPRAIRIYNMLYESTYQNVFQEEGYLHVEKILFRPA